MENKNKELDQYFDDQLEEIQAEQTKNLNKSKKKKKGLKIGLIALILAGVTTITALLWPKKQDNKGNLSTEPTTSTVTPENEVSLDDLGVKFDNPTLEEEKKEYGEVTGNVDKEAITEKNETLWKDEEAANNSSNVGNTEIDDKNGTLEVKPNGDVFVKDEGYEIEKEDGTIVEGTITEEDKQNGEIGSNDTILPPGYVYDENLDKDVVEEDNNKFVYCDADYYDSTGALVYAKGELILKEDLELAKQLLTTTKPVIETQPDIVVPETTVPETTVPETTVPEETFVPTQGTVNADGTYTIDGITFETKADYEQWVIQGFEGYGIDLDGIMKPEEEIKANYNKKTK